MTEKGTATKAEMIEEAVDRMKAFNLLGSVIKDFRKGVLYLSEKGGLLYRLNDEARWLVAEYEERTGYVVFHVIKSHTDIGMMYFLLHVSSYKEEWEMDHEEMADGVHIAFVCNMECPYCSEAGYIAVKPQIGGLQIVF